MKTTMKPEMKQIRETFPALRRRRPTAIIRSGSGQTVYGCLCGSLHTCATRYRDAKHVRDWIAAHEGCARRIAAELDRAEIAFVERSVGRRTAVNPTVEVRS